MRPILFFIILFFQQLTIAQIYSHCRSTPLMNTNFFTKKGSSFYHSFKVENNQIQLTLNLKELTSYQSDVQFETLDGKWLRQNTQSIVRSEIRNLELFNKAKFLGSYQLSSNPILAAELELNDLKIAPTSVEFVVFQLKFKENQSSNTSSSLFVGDLTLFDRVNCWQ